MKPLPAGQAWLHSHPLAVDAILAMGALICMVVGSFADPRGGHGPVWGARTPGLLSLVLIVLAAAALVFRRRAPMTVLAVTGTFSFVELITDEPRAPVAMSAVLALYTVASTTDRPTTWRVGLLTGTVLTTAAMLAGPWPWYAQENIGIFAWAGMAAAAGDAVRSRRAVVHAIRERAERAERTREEEARRRVAEERLRIARDLHDVVAHHIALVNVQAGVAAHVMDKRPDQAKEALAHVREASRSALGELRATVGLLRQSGDPEAPTEPAPGLDRLDELVATFRCAGLPVEVTLSPGLKVAPGGLLEASAEVIPGDASGDTSHSLTAAVQGDGGDGWGRAPVDQGSGLPAAVDLAAYRIVQEALTNVRKHAGAGAGAEVTVVRAGSHLELMVLDTGPRPQSPEPQESVAPPESAGPRDAGPGDRQDAPDGTDWSDLSGPSGAGGGHGLIGMRERAAALGGRCTAGPRYGGGFRVHAILPLKTRTDPAGRPVPLDHREPRVRQGWAGDGNRA